MLGIPKSKSKTNISSDFLECSQMSVISSISKFIESINEMNDIVLVPSKLMDIKLDKSENFDDLHSIHSLLNQLKNELTLGRLECDCNNIDNNNQNNITIINNSFGRQASSRKEKPPESDDGFSSLNSFSHSCCTEEDESSDSDSEFGKSEIKDLRDDYTSPQCLINLFRLHLQGMQTTLNRFTEYAYHISECYKKQIES